MQQILISIAVKLGSQLLINLLRSIADELQQRSDNNFDRSAEVHAALDGISVYGKKK